MTKAKAPIIVLGMLTAIQAGNALWWIGAMFQGALRTGARPFELTSGLIEEVALSTLLGFIAWWWLPRDERSAAGWAVRFLAFAWMLAMGQMAWVLSTGYVEHGVTWAMLLLLLLLGTWFRGRWLEPLPGGAGQPAGPIHPAIIGAALFWLLQLPHLFFSYHWMDTRQIWACRAIAFEARGDLSGIFDCLDPARPPLQSLLLWLGRTNGTIEGRLLPFLMVGAFGLVVYHFLRRTSPRLAPWGVLWFFMTIRIYQGSVSNYADVAVLIAIAVGVMLAVDDGSLVRSRGLAVTLAVVAGMAAALIKRDGGALVLVAAGVLFWFSRRRLDPRLYAALVGGALGFIVWTLRPADLFAPTEWSPPGSAPTPVTVQTFITMFYGMQGQMFSHHGYTMFVPGWILLGIWVWRRHAQLSPEARLWGWLGVLGWLAIIGMYVVHILTGHPGRGSIHVIRTAFGRHLVHMFVFALLSAAALAEMLLPGEARRAETAAE